MSEKKVRYGTTREERRKMYGEYICKKKEIMSLRSKRSVIEEMQDTVSDLSSLEKKEAMMILIHYKYLERNIRQVSEEDSEKYFMSRTDILLCLKVYYDAVKLKLEDIAKS